MDEIDGKTTFEQVLAGITPIGGSGNRKKQVLDYAKIMQVLDGLETGTAQRIRQISRTKAALVEIQHSKELNKSADAYIEALQGQFDEETPHQVAEALGNEVHPGQNSLEAPVAEPQAESVPLANADTPVDVQPNASTPSEAKVDTSSIPDEAKILALLREKGCVRSLLDTNGVNADNFNFQSLSTSLFSKLIDIFVQKSKKFVGSQKLITPEDEMIYLFLLRLQAERNE